MTRSSGADQQEAAPRLDVLATMEAGRTGSRLRFPEPLEALYWQDTASERLRELRFIAYWGLAVYVFFGLALNLATLNAPNWRGVLIQLGGAGLINLAILRLCLRDRVVPALRELGMLVCCLICSVAAILLVALKPSVVTTRDFLQAIPPAIFILIFVRLRFYQALLFFLVNSAVYALALILRPETDRSEALFLFGFMTTLLLPALVGVHAFERMSRRVYLHHLLDRLRNAALIIQNATLTGLSYTDPLTGIANRRRLDEALAALLTAPGSTGALLLVDIDFFKAFNDRYGHLAGDACLCHVARCLGSQLGDADLLARFGGEEFAILLPGRTLDEAARTAERLRESIQRLHFLVLGQRVSVTISIGVAARAGLTDAHALVGAADGALYNAKDAGRNRIQRARCLATSP